MEDYDNIPLVLQPENLKIKLFKHQLSSIYQMEKLEKEQKIILDNHIKETKFGINADPTGFGKTLSMIGLILRDKMSWDVNEPYVLKKIVLKSTGLIKDTYTKFLNKLPTTLILVSSSIIQQWKNELLLYTDLNVNIICRKKDIELINIEDYDVILVTNTMYNNLIKSYSNYIWKRFIFDEPGNIRVCSMKKIHAGFYWFITATPNSIPYFHKDCKNSFIKNIIGDIWWEFESEFKDVIIKNDLDFVKKSFNMPITKYFYHKCFQPVFNILSGLVKDNINTMIEADNIEGVINMLGGKKTENIVDLIKDKKLLEIKELDIKINLCKIKNKNKRLEHLTNIKQRIEEQIKDLNNRYNNMLLQPCFMCEESIIHAVIEPLCYNLFCGKCLLKWLTKKNTCPICRAYIDKSSLIYIKNTKIKKDKNLKENLTRPMTKNEKIVDIIFNNKDGKFLIFSAFNNTFKSICKILKENDITFTIIKGSVNSRHKNIQDFKSGKTQVIFLNSKFDGSGINLQETTDIILYHKMSSIIKNQIIGRAERIGRKESLRVHYLEVCI